MDNQNQRHFDLNQRIITPLIIFFVVLFFFDTKENFFNLIMITNNQCKSYLAELTSKLTLYITVVQPSNVMHWNTVNMARPKLSKLVIPWFGPSQYSSHVVS